MITYDLTPLQAALIEWGKKYPYGRIQIAFQDGVPVQGIVPTDDGADHQTVLFDKVARKAGLIS